MIDDRQLELTLYTVRTSRRAKRVTLHVAPGAGVEVVVPALFDQNQLPDLIDASRDWIDRRTSGLRRRSCGAVAAQRWELPGTIHFPARQERWTIDYRHAAAAQPRLRISGRRDVRIRSDLRAPGQAIAMIRRWCKRMAAEYLGDRVQLLSDQFGLPCAGLALRSQKRVWGTCSSRRTISLNYKLVFLPSPLVDYVITHELCHTRHLDHAQPFRDLLAALMPDGGRFELELKHAWRHIPIWVERG